jgi:hypothetical protein
MLSNEEAWDVAAYVESQARPHKSGLDRDFSSDLVDKPVDAPYGPYADGFTEEQHKYGPFEPIRAAVADGRTRQSTKQCEINIFAADERSGDLPSLECEPDFAPLPCFAQAAVAC